MMHRRAVAQRFLVLVLVLLFTSPIVLFSEKLHDFDFKEIDLRQAIEAIALLENKNVIFSQAVKPARIDLSLKKVSPDVALKAILKTYGYEVIDEKSVLRIVPASERKPASTRTVVILARNILAGEIEKNVKTFLGNEGNVSVNDSSNALIVNAPSDVVERVRLFVEQLDQESRQVYIEAKMVETSTNFSRQLGIQWGSPLSSRSNVTGASLEAKVSNNSFMGGFSTAISKQSQLEAKISAGEKNGDLKILSSPKITTLNGVSANIESSTTFNVRTLAPVSAGSSSGAVLAGGLQSVKAGIRLKVTPFILGPEQVRLDLSISKSDPNFAQNIDGIPGISDNSAATSLRVSDGETASIGGLIYQSQSTSTNGVPFLTQIPILGLLFGSWEKEKIDRELLIFLTPRILRSKAL